MPVLTTPRITTVLFDLDDTLFDHAGTARAALAATAAGRASLHSVNLEELYQQYSECLEEIHPQVMAGRYSYEAARQLRFRRLVAPYETQLATDADIAVLAEQHYAHYRHLRQPMPGALALLEALKPHCRIGIVTNNRTAEQEDKLQFLGMTHLVDALITSEEVGVMKPDPQIYNVALQRLHATAAETVMVGDNWQADIVGAAAVGIRPLWLNRFGAVRPWAHVDEITSLEPVAEIYQKITASSPSVSLV
jgi:HAD superfamily hydrolase (TIGR01509 family)